MTTNNIKEPTILTIGDKYILKQYDTFNRNLFEWHDAFYIGDNSHGLQQFKKIQGSAIFFVRSSEVVDRVRPYEPFTLRNDLRGKFIQMKGASLDDAELARVFDGVVLEQYCIKQMQRGRDHGMSVEQIYDDSNETITIEAPDMITVKNDTYIVNMLAVENEHYSEFIVNMRSRTTFGTDTENIRVFEGQDVNEAATRAAGGYGADVVSISNKDGSPYLSEKSKTSPSASILSKESFEAMQHKLESLEMAIDMDQSVVVPVIPVVIRCDHSSLGILTGYTHRIGEYDHQSGSVQAVVTPLNIEQIKQFPADFAIFELKPLESTLAKSDHTMQKKPELSSNDNTPSQT